MAQSRDETAPSRIELVVLACLSQSKPPTELEIGEALQQLAFPTESADAARRRAGELLAALVRRAWVTGDDQKSRRGRQLDGPSPRKLTDTGKRVLRNAFQLTRVPTWAQARDRYFASLALSVTPGSELAKKACTEGAVTAAVLRTRFGIRDALTPMAVCDALIADALGMPRGRLTLDRIRAHVLRHGIDGLSKDGPSPEVRGYASKLAAWIASSVVGAGTSQRRMARAVARRWVRGEANPLGTSLPRQKAGELPVVRLVAPVEGAAPVPPVSAGEPPRTAPGDHRGAPPTPPLAPPQGLLDAVRDAIPRIGGEGRFGEKVYVSAIWRTIESDRRSGGLSLDHFKRWLVTANRDGWLVLARADVVGAMDAKQVDESEINDRGATFHFVLDQRNGASVSPQESHAG